MGILDRFKTQPKWKASDPAVRAAGVQEIPEDEQDLLAAIVRDDDDPRVRRAAVSKLGTVAVLADTLGRDADEGVRDEAAGVLLDIALGAYEADEAASLAALDALGALPAAAAQKHFVLVAKTAQRESICRAALGRLAGDQKALGTVGRRAEIEGVRMAALEGMTDPAELPRRGAWCARTHRLRSGGAQERGDPRGQSRRGAKGAGVAPGVRGRAEGGRRA
jgi:hypothetical protein